MGSKCQIKIYDKDGNDYDFIVSLSKETISRIFCESQTFFIFEDEDGVKWFYRLENINCFSIEEI